MMVGWWFLPFDWDMIWYSMWDMIWSLNRIPMDGYPSSTGYQFWCRFGGLPYQIPINRNIDFQCIHMLHIWNAYYWGLAKHRPKVISHIHIYIHVYMYTCIHIYIYIRNSVYIYIYVYVYIYMYVYIYVCMYIFTHIYIMYIYTCVIYKHIYTHTLRIIESWGVPRGITWVIRFCFALLTKRCFPSPENEPVMFHQHFRWF